METHRQLADGTVPDRWKDGVNNEVMIALKDMHVGPLGIKLTQGYEKCKLKAYKDGGGVWTIGWGNTTYLDGRRVKEGDTITQAEADKLFYSILPKYELMAKGKIKRNLKQQEFDSVFDFVYNAGTSYKSGGKWRDYKIFENINKGMTGQELEAYWTTLAVTASGVPQRGLVRRRKSEVHMYLTGELDFFE